jgi:hypothetical protein
VLKIFHSNQGVSEVNIQTETAIVPFQGTIKPVRGVDYRILKYSDGEKYLKEEPVSPDWASDQAALIYERSGKEITSGNSLGKNIDIYI